MATPVDGWSCGCSIEVIDETATYITNRVHCIWENQGHRYDLGYNVDGYVTINGTEYTVATNFYVNTYHNGNGGWYETQELGYYDFTISKTHSEQSFTYSTRINNRSSYGTANKSSSNYTGYVGTKYNYAVSYNANGGSGAPSAQTKWYNETLTLSSTIPTRNGYTFSKWNTANNGSGTNYNSGGSYTGNANLNLYAIWNENTYTVSYNANGGSGAPSAQTKYYTSNLTLSSTIPTRTNYNFKGWATSSTGSVTYSPGSIYSSNQSVTLYAIWELAYVAPRINNLSFQRCNSAGTISESGIYIKAIFNWSTDKSVSSIVIQYKLQTSNSWTDVTVSASGTSGSITKVFGDGNFSTDLSYDFRVYISDSLGSSYSNVISIGTIKYPIDIKSGGAGIAFGKAAETDNLADFAFDAKFRGEIFKNDQKVTGCTPIYVNTYAGIIVTVPNVLLYQMLTFHIRGHGYSTTYPIDTIIQAYHYNSVGNFTTVKQLNNGGNLPACKIMIYNNNIVLWIPTPGSYSSLIIEGWNTNVGNAPLDLTIQASNTMPSGTNQTTCTVYPSLNISLSSLILNYIYPIGSIYITINSNFNPNNTFGGTWTKLTGDAYLKIVTSSAGSYGGTSSNHKIPLSSIPSHEGHIISWADYGTTTYYMDISRVTQYATNRPYHVEAGNEAMLNTYNQGGGAAYYPYYYGVYVWKRTA